MVTTPDEVTTLLVAPVPPHVPAPVPRLDPDANTISLGVSFTPSVDVAAAAGSASGVLESLEKVREILQRAGAGTIRLAAPPADTSPDHVARWHRQHHHLGYLDSTIDAPEGTRIDPVAAGATRWTTAAALRSVPLPAVGSLLSTLSGPREVLLAGIEAVLAVPPTELTVLGSHALLAGLSGAGGVVVGRRPLRPATGTATTPGAHDRPDPAERLAVYRPPAWPRQQCDPGYTVVVEADGASPSLLTETVDSVLSGSRGDIEIAVRGGDHQQAQFARHYEEEPRFRALEALRIGPRVLLVSAGSILTNDTLVDLARRHEEHVAGLLLVTHAGDDQRSCAASFETGAWRRAAAVAGHPAIDGPPPLTDLRTVLEQQYRTWWCNADDVGLRRPSAVAPSSDLLDGTSAPSRRVLAELEQQQRLLASTRDELRRVERELARLRRHPLVRVGRAVRRHLA